jgi:AcrR family transcriptional regulator
MAKKRPPPPKIADDPVFFRMFADQVRKGERRKLEIVRAALEVLTEQGIHRTTYEAVAQKLGIGRSQVAYHFPTLQALFALAIKYMIDTIQSATIEHVEAAPDARGRVLAVFSAIYGWAERDPVRARALTLLYHLAGHDPYFRELHTGIRDAGQKRLGQLVIEYRAEWALRPRELASMCRVLQSLSLGSIAGVGAVERAEDLIPSLEDVHNLVRYYIDK